MQAPSVPVSAPYVTCTLYQNLKGRLPGEKILRAGRSTFGAQDKMGGMSGVISISTWSYVAFADGTTQ